MACCHALRYIGTTQDYPKGLAPGAARDLFFSRFGLWCHTVLPAYLAAVALMWLLLRLVLPDDIQTLRNIYTTAGPVSLLIMALAFLGYKKSTFIDDEKARKSGEILGIKSGAQKVRKGLEDCWRRKPK